MPLMILGLIFVIGLFAYYLISTSGNSSSKKETKTEKPLKSEENVIFLPTDLEKEKKKHKR